MGTRTYNVAAALAVGPMTFDALKKRLLDDLLYTDAPGLRRWIAQAVYHLQAYGLVSKRGNHGDEVSPKFRRWEITPSGRDALLEAEKRFRSICDGDPILYAEEKSALDAVVVGKVD